MQDGGQRRQEPLTPVMTAEDPQEMSSRERRREKVDVMVMKDELHGAASEGPRAAGVADSQRRTHAPGSMLEPLIGEGGMDRGFKGELFRSDMSHSRQKRLEEKKKDPKVTSTSRPAGVRWL